MKAFVRYFLAFFVVFITMQAHAQTVAEQSLRKDYPLLVEKYGASLEGQHAHYIFAVDISSSMREYEDVVKSNFLTFVDAIPNGDKITLIRMANKQYTDYVGMFQCIELDNTVRNELRSLIYSDQFRFLSTGSPKDGSDGYKMASLVVNAINTIGSSNDLTFVYLFTDFEYWTNEYNYDPSKENWAELESKIPAERRFAICKYGLELNFDNPNIRHSAIFKNNLDRIFGDVNYQEVTSANVLSQWFSHTIANVLAVKLNSLVEQDWNSFTDCVGCETEGAGNKVKLNVKYQPVNQISGIEVVTSHNDPNFNSSAVTVDLDDSGCQEVVLGEYDVKPTSFIPSFKELGGGSVKVDLNYKSPYMHEIDRLQELCKRDEIGTNKDVAPIDKNLPAVQVWNSVLPMWVWILIAVIVLIVIVSIFYTTFGIKLDREWQVSVVRFDSEGNRTKELSTFIKAPGEIKSTIDKKTTNDWEVSLTAKKYNPLNFFKLGKSGYYITLLKGSFVEFMDPYAPKLVLHTASVGDEKFVSSYKNPSQIMMTIKSSGNTYKITIN